MRFATKKMRAAAVVLFVLAAACAGCKKAAVDPFPPTGALSGWEKTGETRTFAAKDLYQYIDGDADQYVSAGVVTTSTADYKYQGGLEATVDVHTMGDAAGAGKIFSKDLSSDGQSVAIGDAGVAHAQSVVFHKGRFLVRIVSYQSTPGSSDALQSLARAIAAKL
jgi:hypothetical protein